MDFGIGASVRQAGWFLPVVWTPTYSLLLPTLVFTWMHHRARPRSSYTSICLTTIAQTGIASNSSLVAMLFGFLAFHERLERYQLLGLALVLSGVVPPDQAAGRGSGGASRRRNNIC